jgi:hypothetical protein
VVNGSTTFSAVFAHFNLTVQALTFSVNDVIQQDTKIGDQHVHALANLINIGGDILIPIINTIIPVI